MSERIRAVVGCGTEGCEQLVARGEELGRIVDRVIVGDGEVWQIDWPDGTMDLISTTQLAGVRTHRPPNRPPGPKTATG